MKKLTRCILLVTGVWLLLYSVAFIRPAPKAVKFYCGSFANLQAPEFEITSLALYQAERERKIFHRYEVRVENYKFGETWLIFEKQHQIRPVYDDTASSVISFGGFSKHFITITELDEKGIKHEYKADWIWLHEDPPLAGNQRIVK